MRATRRQTRRQRRLDRISNIAAVIGCITATYAFTFGTLIYGERHPVTLAAFAIAAASMAITATTGGYITWTTTNCSER